MKSNIDNYINNFYICPNCGEEIISNSFNIKRHNKLECKKLNKKNERNK